MVEEMETFFTYAPFATAGFAFITASAMARKFSESCSRENGEQGKAPCRRKAHALEVEERRESSVSREGPE